MREMACTLRHLAGDLARLARQPDQQDPAQADALGATLDLFGRRILALGFPSGATLVQAGHDAARQPWRPMSADEITLLAAALIAAATEIERDIDVGEAPAGSAAEVITFPTFPTNQEAAPC
jgi:hypothetical protein